MNTSATTGKGLGALDAFLNLLSLITLGWLVYSVGSLLLVIIDVVFGTPGIRSSLSFMQGSIKFNIASIIIIGPAFFAALGSLHRQYKADHLRHDSGIYRWLTYAMLLITALTIIGSLINIIYQFLDGSYTVASILKVLVIFALASGIFGYYFYDLKRGDYKQPALIAKIFLAVSVVVIVGSLIGSLFVVESPAVTRLKKYDSQRINELMEISNLLAVDYDLLKKLPADLSDLKFKRFVDPVSGKPYDYRVIDERSYELCADFALVSEGDDYGYMSDPYTLRAYPWYAHQAGHQCFTKKIEDPNQLAPKF